MRKDVYVLGIHCNYFNKTSKVHNSSACLLKNGEIIAAISEERLSRIKCDGSYPYNSIREVLKIGNINMREVSYVAYSRLHPIDANIKSIKAHFSTLKDTGIWPSKSYFRVFKNFFQALKYSKKTFFEFDGVKKKLYYGEHHLSHAASTYYTAPFEKCLVITLDGGGDGLDGAVYYGNNCELKLLSTIPSFQSPCTMYSGLTFDLGFKRLRHEGKLTGLAAFGKADLDILKDVSIIKYDFDKKRFISKLIAKHHKNLEKPSPYFSKYLNLVSKENLAAYLQEKFEEAVINYINDSFNNAKEKKYDIQYIALAGGAFANVKLNQKIFNLGYFKNIHVFPAMGDDGLSVGAALHTYFDKEKIKDRTSSIIDSAYFGSSFEEKDIKLCLEQNNLTFKKLDNIHEEIGRLLAEGKVVARFEGKMEFGPRALGNRSILASPFDQSINDWLNKKLKRTEFMPFAPSIISERASDYFHRYPEGISAATFMTITCDVRQEMQGKIPAVVHVDGTARPQIVYKKITPGYHKIISSFEKHTGIPVILNTSFNMHEEPIVCTPSDAVRGFLSSGIDYLAIENFLVEQKTYETTIS